MSALTPKADIRPQILDVRFVPIADIKPAAHDDPRLENRPIEVVSRRLPTEQVTITCYFKAKMFEMLSRLAISLAV